MKKYLYLMVATIGVALASSCNKELPTTEIEESGKNEYTRTFEGSGVTITTVFKSITVSNAF